MSASSSADTRLPFIDKKIVRQVITNEILFLWRHTHSVQAAQSVIGKETRVTAFRWFGVGADYRMPLHLICLCFLPPPASYQWYNADLMKAVIMWLAVASSHCVSGWVWREVRHQWARLRRFYTALHSYLGYWPHTTAFFSSFPLVGVFVHGLLQKAEWCSRCWRDACFQTFWVTFPVFTFLTGYIKCRRRKKDLRKSNGNQSNTQATLCCFCCFSLMPQPQCLWFWFRTH